MAPPRKYAGNASADTQPALEPPPKDVTKIETQMNRTKIVI